MRERRDLLTSVRRAITRWAFLAELVFAMLFGPATGGLVPAPSADSVLKWAAVKDKPPICAAYKGRLLASQSALRVSGQEKQAIQRVCACLLPAPERPVSDARTLL